MKHQWVAYAIVALLSVGAGVAIAGLPNNEPVDPTIIPPTTTERPTPTLATTTIPTTPATTAAPETTAAASTTTVLTTTTTTVADLPPRSELSVAAVNGADIGGIASATAAELEALGYGDVTPLDGTVIAEFTVIYFAPGFEDSAIRLADDLGANPVLRAPLVDAPSVAGLPDVQLMAYLGQDRPAP